VVSLDWHEPTLGELEPTPDNASSLLPASQNRLAAEEGCRSVLKDHPRLAGRFETLLAVAQRYAALREEQARELTLGWPTLRRIAIRLGQYLVEAGVVAAADDIHFLTRAEFVDAINGDLSERDTVSRRATWNRQRRLAAPLQLGRTPRYVPILFAGYGVGRPAPIGTALAGQPASSGRAIGPARILDSPNGARLNPGDILVAPTTTPAWTPLFGLAAAIVTDGGNVASHASLVAREFGIPAVVATGNATQLLRDGQVVTVDGTAGT